MLYIMSQKFFKKHTNKLVAPNDYFVIDGENSGVTNPRHESIATKFNNTYPLGGWCPDDALYRELMKIKRGEDVSKGKLEKLTERYLKSKDFIAAACASIKAQAANGVTNDINIFVVLPNVVYKQLGTKIKKRLTKLVAVDFEFIRMQDDINKKALTETLKKKQLKEILKVIAALEKKKKYLHDFNNDDDD